MWKFCLMLSGFLLFAACAPSLAPNGMSWDEYHAAKYRLKVTYAAADVLACEKLGVVRGSSDDDMGGAKEVAIENALLLKGNTVLFGKLWSDLHAYRMVGRPEIFYAEGSVYRCPE